MYDLDAFMKELKRKNPDQPEFIQAVRGVLSSIIDLVNGNPVYEKNRILERMTEPDRILQFRVEWENDKGELEVNRAWRVQFNNAIGPYKGGTRFTKDLTLGTLKFLAFEQTFKNSLTTLPMGGGKGGCDFDPAGKSDREIMRFCRAYMMELQKYIGPDTDVPAGDLGCGGREIGYMYGMYKQIKTENTGVLTGKDMSFGGSILRPEATGYGAIYFAEEMLKDRGDKLEGKRIAISGYGNVAWGVAKKASQLGAKVVTLSGRKGFVLDEEGVGTQEKWDFLEALRASNTGNVEAYARRFGAKFFPGEKPWGVKCDMAFPCASQNELDLADAKTLVAGGCKYVVESSNMGDTPEATEYFQSHGVAFAPGKAANAGGVACSGLEMSQDAMHYRWSAAEVDEKLHEIMQSIHKACVDYGRRADGTVDYVRGANAASFKHVADTMLKLGY